MDHLQCRRNWIFLHWLFTGNVLLARLIVDPISGESGIMIVCIFEPPSIGGADRPFGLPLSFLLPFSLSGGIAISQSRHLFLIFFLLLRERGPAGLRTNPRYKIFHLGPTSTLPLGGPLLFYRQYLGGRINPLSWPPPDKYFLPLDQVRVGQNWNPR